MYNTLPLTCSISNGTVYKLPYMIQILYVAIGTIVYYVICKANLCYSMSSYTMMFTVLHNRHMYIHYLMRLNVHSLYMETCFQCKCYTSFYTYTHYSLPLNEYIIAIADSYT